MTHFSQESNFDEIEKSRRIVMPDLIRHPGFPLTVHKKDGEGFKRSYEHFGQLTTVERG
jgi:hypothetical protein